MTLPPHLWDDEPHRGQIHQAFDQWFIAYMCAGNNHHHIGRLKRELERLIEEAKLREMATTRGRGIQISMPLGV